MAKSFFKNSYRAGRFFVREYEIKSRKGEAIKMKQLTGLLLIMLSSASLIAGEWEQKYKYNIPSSQQLRAFGSVSSESATYSSPKGEVGVSTFTCVDKDKAATLIGKFLADLTLSENVKEIILIVNGKEITAKQTSSGAVFIGCIDGMTAKIISSDNKTAIEDFLKENDSEAFGAVNSAKYPTYLDRFDRYGWGIYGLGGWGNDLNWMQKSGENDQEKDPTEDLDFLVKNKFRFEPWLDPSKFDNSDGIIKNTESEWMVKEAKRKGLPISFRVYDATGGADWTARRFPEFIDQNADFLQSGWHGPSLYYTAQPHLSWKTDAYRYLSVKTMEKMKQHVDDDNVMGWMHPVGELQHDKWYAYHADYSPAAKADWHNWLQKNNVNLNKLSKMYARESLPFTDWDQVNIPEYATFAGLPGLIKDLTGTWYCRMVSSPDQGMVEEWWKTDTSLDKWRAMKLPGNDQISEVLDNPKKYKNKKAEHSTWFKRNVNVAQDELQQNEDIFLYWFPISHAGVHSGKNKEFHHVYINGKKAGEIGQWGALEIKDMLKVGLNEVSLKLISPVWNGRIFLSNEKPSVYPYLGQERNELWTLWKAWIIDTKYAKSGEILDGMRQVDANRPIKFMAPSEMGSERWLDLGKRYGTWGHFTGEGVWFYPWYKRYGYLYGLPGTCETAGPAKNLDQQFNSFRRIFLAGLNSHDAVFLAQTYTRNPDLRKFWEEHNPVLKRLGRFDIHGPQVLLFRSTRETTLNAGIKPYPELGKATRPIQNPWNWDIGRGTLQTLGHSYLYLCDKGIKDGKMAPYKVMFDIGNETMDPKSIEGIANWVNAGGTFITLPFTGRNTSLEPDSWPISKLTNCEVSKIRKPGKGMITIKKDQSVFKALAGNTFPDNGSSIDWIGNEHNLISTELKPGDDCEVLATFENGKPAIVKRKLGKGQVIVCGSAFYKGVEDRMGIWWPEERETDFIADLLDGIGYGKASCQSDDRLVWAQPYRSVNGLNYENTLISWHDDKAVEVNLTLDLPSKPKNIISYGVDGIKDLKFTWSDGQAVVNVNMPAKEVKVISADVYDHSSVVNHWWNRQQHYWFELQKPMIDFSPYSKGKYVDPTLNLRKNGKLTTKEPAQGWNSSAEFNDKDWKDCDFGILNFEGAEASKPVWLRKTFKIPEQWQSEGGKIHLITAKWVAGGVPYQGKAQLFLNGKMLHDFNIKGNYHQFDVTKLLEDDNAIAFEFKGDTKYQGFIGDLYLYHEKPAARTVSLAGTWVDKNNNPIQLPGAGKATSPTRTILIPEEWKNKYNIRLYLKANNIIGGYINNRLVRRHHHRFGDITDIDITHRIKFGQENVIELDKDNHIDVKEVSLRLFEK